MKHDVIKLQNDLVFVHCNHYHWGLQAPMVMIRGLMARAKELIEMPAKDEAFLTLIMDKAWNPSLEFPFYRDFCLPSHKEL